MIYLKLFFEFFKIGLFSVGGGLATLPLLQEAVLGNGWLTTSEFIDMIAVSHATPGPIGINMATYAGFKTAGIFGGIIATTGIVCPSFIIIIFIAKFMNSFSNNLYVSSALSGLRPAAVGMIAAASIYIFGNSIFMIDLFPEGKWFKPDSAGIFMFLCGIYMIRKLNPVIILVIGALAGIFIF